MTTAEIVYKFNAPRMIHETIDKETVVIDTETGVYFSITGSGYLIVQALDQGARVADLVARLAAVFSLEPVVLHSQVTEFVAQLLVEEMIVADTNAPGATTDFALTAGEAYAPPVLEKFTDMHDLLLMDPIHEVSDAGWPHRI
jgi:hypothetical protein